MAHRIGQHEAIGAALRRLVSDDLSGARITLGASGKRAERIHQARQRLKRARSILRVLKPAVGERADSARATLREAAHLLAGARDADAAAASARGLRATVAADDDAGLDRVVAELDRKAAEAHRKATPVDEVVERLATVEAELGAVDGDFKGSRLFDAALARSYRKGRDAMRQAGMSLATPDLHSWRKEVKDLWHLIRVARKRLPKRVSGMADDLKQLGELLGFDHDHAVLAERLALSPSGDPSLMRQLSIIAAERRALEARAFGLGARLYKRKPKEFARKARLD